MVPLKIASFTADPLFVEHILVIDDDALYRERLDRILTARGALVTAVACAHDAFEALARDSFDAFVCDLHLPFILDERIVQYQYSIEVGLGMVRELRWLFPSAPIVAVNEVLPHEHPTVLSRLEGIPLLAKPFSDRQLITSLMGRPRPHRQLDA